MQSLEEQLKNWALDTLDYCDDNASSISQRSQLEFKTALMDQYGQPIWDAQLDGYVLKCQLTHCFLPRPAVIASHLWKRAWVR